jgi:hypothetical protein
LHLDFSQICSPDQWFGVENWAPFITISGVDIGGDNQYGGCAIDAFGLEWKPYDRKIHEMINMWANLRVRGAGFSLFKISYSLTVSGLFVDPPEDPLLE